MVERIFIPGDDWLYFKIYTGRKTADRILSKLSPAIAHLIEIGVVQKWFFIRYIDSDFHVRLRFNLSNGDTGKVIKTINACLKKYVVNNLIWKVQLDSYSREIERYGENTMELSEEIFWHDSEMVVSLMKDLEVIDSDEKRWLLAISAIDSLLGVFKLTIEKKRNLLFNIKSSFAREFGLERDKELREVVKQRYRDKKVKIQESIKSCRMEDYEDNSVYEVLKMCAVKQQEVVNKILDIYNRGELQVELNALISSFIHMMMNRFFRSKPRAHELLIYDFLFRVYESEIARSIYKNIN